MNLKSMSMDSAELNAYAIWEAIEGKRAGVRLPVENTTRRTIFCTLKSRSEEIIHISLGRAAFAKIATNQ